MKTIYLFIALFSIAITTAQQNQKPLTGIAESEMKAAAKTMSFVTNANTQNYDVTYHKLEFTVNPNSYHINGIVTTTFKALSNMTTVTFDLTNQLIVSSVKKNNVALAFTQNNNDELVITLPSTLTTGNSATVEITYSGSPALDNEAFTTENRPGTNSKILYTLSEPFGARDWWPCKQDLNDKVDSIDVYITAPSQYISVSNGIETTAPVVSGSNKTTHFHHGYPIPAYLVAIAVTNYTVYNQTGGTPPNQYPIINYLYPETASAVEAQLDETPLILNLYESLFEIYPFHNEKYGHAQFGWGGGMEHTTVSFMVGFDRQLIAHEMAHQWFGDKITCGSWKDIWLNEGFATYLSALVIENFDGQDSFTYEKSSMIDDITSETSGNLYLSDLQATNSNRIFSSRLSYDKGAMVLNMLRFKMGDAAFFQGLKSYLADPNLAYKYAVTSDLQAHLETAYGSSLTEFFNDWVYNQGYPTYNIVVKNLVGGQAKFTVNQTQSDPSVDYFEMPVPVRVYGNNGEQLDLVLDNTANGQIFIENVPFTITYVEFDPKRDLISKDSNIVLGTGNFELSGLKLYPNPASDKLSLELPNGVTVQKTIFYNTLGQKEKETSTETSWNISSLAIGVHFINVVTDSGTKQIKFIKK